MAYPHQQTGCPLCVIRSCNFSLSGRGKNTLNIYNNLTAYPQCIIAHLANSTSSLRLPKRTRPWLHNKPETGPNLSAVAKLAPCRTRDYFLRLNPTISKVQARSKCPNARVTANTCLLDFLATGWLTSTSAEPAPLSRMLSWPRPARPNGM